MKYKIYTFRGFVFTDGNFYDAWDKGNAMLTEIRKDGFDKGYWWFVIIDLANNKKKIVSSYEEGQVSSTHWIWN